MCRCVIVRELQLNVIARFLQFNSKLNKQVRKQTRNIYLNQPVQHALFIYTADRIAIIANMLSTCHIYFLLCEIVFIRHCVFMNE